MARVNSVTSETFSREVMFSSIPVVVDVYADWCGPCRALAPLLDRYAEMFAGEVKFLKVNADQEPDVAQIYGVQSLPTLLLFKDGQLIDRVVGLPTVPTLTRKLESLTGRPHRISSCC